MQTRTLQHLHARLALWLTRSDQTWFSRRVSMRQMREPDEGYSRMSWHTRFSKPVLRKSPPLLHISRHSTTRSFNASLMTPPNRQFLGRALFKDKRVLELAIRLTRPPGTRQREAFSCCR